LDDYVLSNIKEIYIAEWKVWVDWGSIGSLDSNIKIKTGWDFFLRIFGDVSNRPKL
jgi:hypothetical protein